MFLWFGCAVFSVLCVAVAALWVLADCLRSGKKQGASRLKVMFVGVFAAAVSLFLPVHLSEMNGVKAVLLSVFHSMQMFAMGCDFEVIGDHMAQCPQVLTNLYLFWTVVVYVLAPVMTFGFVLSLFKNISAQLKYWCGFFRNAYIFTQLNEKSLALATDIKKNEKQALLVFADVFDDDEKTEQLHNQAEELGAVCFKKDVASVKWGRHSSTKKLCFFAVSEDETENLNHGLTLAECYRERENAHLYVVATGVESDLLLTAAKKGKLKIRRINPVQSLINRILYEDGKQLFDHAGPADESGQRQIGAVVVGMGQHGTEMVKALTWFGQMDGYRIRITAFDKDPLAQERFAALAPELMSEKYNGVYIPGEAQYAIRVCPDVDVESVKFSTAVTELKDTTYVFVALGNDTVNIQTAVRLRMYFERMGIHPVIHAVVYNSQQKKALEGVCNYRGQAYDIDFIGDMESSFCADVILHSELEEDALRRHLRWGQEDEFWNYEYNYRSSVASAIHLRTRILCKIPGADKKEEELTPEERTAIETLEHRRWNAYMRAEGYIYSGSKEKSSRNDLAKMHHDLVEYEKLSEEEKRKDSRVGTV